MPALTPALSSERYLFTGVRPSSAAATSARSSQSDISQAGSFSSVSAPEDGRTPLNTYSESARSERNILGRSGSPIFHAFKSPGPVMEFDRFPALATSTWRRRYQASA